MQEITLIASKFLKSYPILKKNFRVIIPDLLGFGFSPRCANKQYSPAKIISNLVDIIDNLKIRQKLKIVGASMGGSAAIKLTNEVPYLIDKLVGINRVAKVVKGGRRFGFAALVIVGDQKGSIGVGKGKSKQVPDAIKKATELAKRNMFKISLKDSTSGPIHSIVSFLISFEIIWYIISARSETCIGTNFVSPL